MGRLAILRRRRAPVRRPDRSRRKSVDRHLRTQRPFREAVGRFGNADPSSRFPTQSNAARRPKRRRPPLHPCRGAGASRGGPATPADKATLPPTRAEKLKKQLLRPPCRQYRLRAPSFPANLRHPPDRHETARHRGLVDVRDRGDRSVHSLRRYDDCVDLSCASPAAGRKPVRAFAASADGHPTVLPESGAVKRRACRGVCAMSFDWPSGLPPRPLAFDPQATRRSTRKAGPQSHLLNWRFSAAGCAFGQPPGDFGRTRSIDCSTRPVAGPARRNAQRNTATTDGKASMVTQRQICDPIR